MNRTVGIVLVVALVVGLGIVLAQGPRFAQSPGHMAQQRMPAPVAQRAMWQHGLGFAVVVEFSLHDEAALALGITTAELQALRAAGRSLAEIAEERGVDLQALQATLLAARDAAIDQAVAEGLIDALRGDAMKSRSDAVVAALMTREGCAECPWLAGEGRAMAQQGAMVPGRAAMMSADRRPRHLNPRWGR